VLGALLLVAVMVNNYVRGRAEKAPTASGATRPDRTEIAIVVPAEPAKGAKEEQQ